MSETRTFLSDIINPEVLKDMISADLPKALRVTGMYKVDRTLAGRPGNTIKIPRWDYIGAAYDTAEGVEGTLDKLGYDMSAEYTVKKITKNICLTDEAVLSGYGSPMTEAARQLRMALADKIDNDGISLLSTYGGDGAPETDLVVTTSEKLGYDTILDGVDKFEREEQGGTMYLLCGQEGIKDVRRDRRYIDAGTAFSSENYQNGTAARVAGCLVRISNKIEGKVAYIILPGALTCFMKRSVAVETARDILKKQTLISADCHYVVAITDASKIVRINFGAETAPDEGGEGGGDEGGGGGDTP